jgi:hypothetical protein
METRPAPPREATSRTGGAAPWQPRPGDRVRIRRSRLAGVIHAIDRRAGARCFVVSVGPLSSTDPPVAFRLRTTVGPMRVAHTLDELEPYRP